MSDEKNEVEEGVRSNMEVFLADPSEIPNDKADQMASSIHKLNVDCFEELFEWLSLADLRSLRQTCRRLKQVVDYFIKSNYPAMQLGFGSITLCNGNFDQFQHFDAETAKMIKEASIYGAKIGGREIDVFKAILPQLLKLNVHMGGFYVDFYESIIKWCSHLKYLSVHGMLDGLIGKDNKWMHHEYPTIEHVAMYRGSISEYPGLKTFFELNPNIQTFSTPFNFLWVNRNSFLHSNIKINLLIMQGDGQFPYEANEVYDILNRLYEQGFYRQLHLFIHFVENQTAMNQIISLRGMKKLHIGFFNWHTEIILRPMPELRELYFNDEIIIENFESIAKNLRNVERVYFKNAKADIILPLLRYAPKVKEIKVHNLKRGSHMKNGIIDLVAWNEERKRLAGACKITIFVWEHIFLLTKFAINNTELSLVTLKRSEAADWNNVYE